MVDRILSDKIFKSLQEFEKKSPPVEFHDDLLNVVSHFAAKMEEDKASLNNEPGLLFNSYQQSYQWEIEFKQVAEGKDLQGYDFDGVLSLALSAHGYVTGRDDGKNRLKKTVHISPFELIHNLFDLG